MKLRVVPTLIASGVVGLAAPASAGGLFLPGSGAISTARAGAAVASADDGEALSINPAGLAKTSGVTLTISASLVRYYMQFTRDGAYDDVSPIDVQGYEGQRFGTVVNEPKPPLGLGSYQPLPVIAVAWDLGKRVKGLTLAAGLYAPQGYPFRDMTQGYKFNEDTGAPPPTRYDVMSAESTALFPTIAAAYRITPKLDVGARFSAGTASAKQQVVVWGTTGNVEESVRNDTLFNAEVKDGFVPTFGLGLTFRPTPNIELGAVYNAAAALRLKGSGLSVKGPSVDAAKVVGPIGDNPVTDRLRCDAEGTFENGGKVPACISLQLPQNATIGARYKFLDGNGEQKADIELNVGWENWGKQCKFDTAAGILEDQDCVSPGQLLVNLDAGLYVNDSFTEPLQVNAVNLGLQDVFTFRLGGSYNMPLGAGKNRITLRGGVGYDTRAAREGWLRASFDGAARVTTTVGAAYRAPKWELNIGGGAVLEGTNRNPGAGAGGALCNPTRADPSGCVGDGTSNPPLDRQGPDPTNPLFVPEVQFESPINQGTIKSNYVLFMLGYTRWF